MLFRTRGRRASQLFADQFEAAGSGFVYRHSLKGPPRPVGEEERDAFCARYDRRMRRLPWAAAGITLLVVLPLALFGPGFEHRFANLFSGAVGVLLFAGILVVQRWEWNHPRRVLCERASVGPALSREELSRRRLAQVSYRQLVLAPVLVGVLMWRISERLHLPPQWNAFWLALCTALLTLIAIQAFRKWRAERDR
ncbi:hypothetical protein HT136_04840 [Novosphingobium profundi]|uniref:hypothetical protein n=1 Tax=Novosphingobium profundi TaxID=1774954 RepID=UPI001BD9EDD8|nr:hypothetical protein [Novosphingobium profundi]MBT0667689.1 hypothetical protein [Novosphingobium profundi]